MNNANRPIPGHTYHAPIALCSNAPLVPGEANGAIVDETSRQVAVLYSTREAAAQAFADPTIWAAANAARYRIAAVIYRGGPRPFEFANDAERNAHALAVTTHAGIRETS